MLSLDVMYRVIMYCMGCVMYACICVCTCMYAYIHVVYRATQQGACIRIQYNILCVSVYALCISAVVVVLVIYTLNAYVHE